MCKNKRVSERVEAAIVAEVSAGLGREPFKCLTAKSPEKEVKRLKKSLKSSENWEIYGATAYNTCGIPFNGLASWGRNISVRLNGREFRYRTLRLDRHGNRTVYAIPISMVATFSKLPDIETNTSEIAIIEQMAGDLARKKEVLARCISIAHPAKPALKDNRAQWLDVDFDAPALLRLLEEIPELRDIVAAATSVHYRSFLDAGDIPDGLFNFVLQPKSRDSDLWFYTVLQSLTFANIQSTTTAGPITVTMKEAADLQRWRRCNERLAVIRTATGALLWPLLEQMEERERITKGGGRLSEALPTVPISLTNGTLHHPQAADTLLPVNPPPLTCAQQDLLRAAMSRLLWRRHAEAALAEWKKRRRLPCSYRQNGFAIWRDVLQEHILKVWFPEQEHVEDVRKLSSDSQQRKEEQEQMIVEKLQRGIELLTNIQAYQDEIVDRPDTVDDWKNAMKEGMLAFWYTPKGGDDKGTKLLAFQADTLKRLIRRAGCTDELYRAFLDRCDKRGILDSRGKTINLKGSITAITFNVEKF